MIVLRPYQRECLDAIAAARGAGCYRQLVSLPTAAGKTVIFGSLIKEMGGRALILAHTSEILTQAKNKIEMLAPGTDVGIVDANSKEFDKPVVVASIQSARLPENLHKLSSSGFQTCIVDEAHRSASDSYRAVLKALKMPLVVGFTATAFRTDSRGLGEDFDRIVYQKTPRDLIEAGYLCPPRGIKVATDLDLSAVTSAGDDFNITSLAEVMDVPEINELVVKSYLEHAAGRPSIVFGTTVMHAYHLTEAFQAKGVISECIHGGMGRDERAKIIDAYQAGAITALCNCQVLTEGFDAAHTSCVIVARPTKSRGLYTQMAGRGLRLFPGKTDCIVLDFGDRNHSLCSSAVLLMDAEAVDDREEKKHHKHIVERLPVKLNQQLKLAYLQVNLLNENEPFNWIKNGNDFVLKGSGTNMLTVSPEGNGKYAVYLTGIAPQKLATGLNFDYAFSSANDYATTNRHLFAVSDREAAWRDLPPTEKQIALLRGQRFKAGIEQLTRGQAADIISSGILWRKAS